MTEQIASPLDQFTVDEKLGFLAWVTNLDDDLQTAIGQLPKDELAALMGTVRRVMDAALLVGPDMANALLERALGGVVH